MGSAQQLTRPGREAVRPLWARHGLYAAGTVSLLGLSLLASLAVWTVLPWALLGWSPTVVVSGSMSPAVRTGDVVLLCPLDADADGGVDPTAAPPPPPRGGPHADGGADADTVGVGSVVAYDEPQGGRVLHRVVQRTPDGSYLLQGDANPTPDPTPVPAAQVRGAAVLLIPGIGWPSVWLGRGDLLAVAGAGAALLACLRLVSYAVDPLYDPWAGGGRVLPVRVLLAASDASTGLAGQCGLLPPELRTLVLTRLAEQADATHRRHTELVQALS